MRWLALLLVLANVGFFAWHHRLSDSLLDRAPPLPAEAAPALDRLGEMDPEELVKRTPVSSRASGARIAEASCFAVGPLTGEYSEGAVLGRVREWLKSRGGEVDLRRRRRQEIRYYWLYLRPAGTRGAAQDRVRELVANAFGNAVVIPAGNMKNAVSIGVYGLRSDLERDLTRLERKGFEPEVRPVLRTGRALWFIARFPPGYEFPKERFDRAFRRPLRGSRGGGHEAPASSEAPAGRIRAEGRALEVVDTRCPPPREPPAGPPSPALPEIS